MKLLVELEVVGSAPDEELADAVMNTLESFMERSIHFALTLDEMPVNLVSARRVD